MTDSTSLPDDAWTQAVVDAALGPAALGVLADGPADAYAVLQAVERRGLGAVLPAVLLAVLDRHLDAGRVSAVWVTDDAGPERRVYTLTDAGRAAHARALEIWGRAGAALGAPAGTGTGAGGG